MIRKQLMRRGMLVGVFAVFGCLGGAGMLLANDDDDDKHPTAGTIKSGRPRPWSKASRAPTSCCAT